jgi:hypothetical protein
VKRRRGAGDDFLLALALGLALGLVAQIVGA